VPSILIMGYPEKGSENGREVRLLSGFFTEEDSTVQGKYDFNAEKYKLKQSHLANRIEDLTGVALWATKPKFAEYDYHLCKDNNPNKLIGSGTAVPGIPMYWIPVDGIAELKYRTVASDRFDSTLLDADKMKEMVIHHRVMDLPAWIIWAFTDCDMYYKVDPTHRFDMILGRNTQVSEDLPQEYKPQIFIPMAYLKSVSADMFNKETILNGRRRS